jgi:hypothetical protein
LKSGGQSQLENLVPFALQGGDGNQLEQKNGYSIAEAEARVIAMKEGNC